MAALALHKGLAIKAVRLVALVAAATKLVFAEVEATPGFVGFLVAVFARNHLVLVFERPASEFVIEAFFAPLDGSPAHHVEAPALVLKVAGLAFLTLHLGRCVVALAGTDAFFKVVVIVAVEALVAVDGLAVVDVAVIAAVLIVEPRMLLGQRAWA